MTVQFFEYCTVFLHKNIAGGDKMLSVGNIFYVICGYTAAIIGAGFASGQEIITFFIKYGKSSIIGVMVACILFGFFAYAVVSYCIEKNIYTYADFLNSMFKTKFKNFSVITALIFSIVTICVMTSCSGEMFFLIFGKNKIFGAIILSITCGIVFLLNAHSVMKINSFLGGVIILGIIFSCLYIVNFRDEQTYLSNTKMLASSLSYVGYNLISTGAILAQTSKRLVEKRDAVAVGIGSGIVLMVIITLLWVVLKIYYNKINLGELPMLTLACRQNNLFGMFYGIMLFASVLTTALSNGFCILDMPQAKDSRRIWIVTVLAVSFAFSGFGFSRIINIAYRICGYGGSVIVFAIIYKSIKNHINR